MHFSQTCGTMHVYDLRTRSEMGMGFFELVILAGIPLLLVIVGVIAFILVRASKK